MHGPGQRQVIEFAWIDRKMRAVASAECRNISILLFSECCRKQKKPGGSGLPGALIDRWRAEIDFGMNLRDEFLHRGLDASKLREEPEGHLVDLLPARSPSARYGVILPSARDT